MLPSHIWPSVRLNAPNQDQGGDSTAAFIPRVLWGMPQLVGHACVDTSGVPAPRNKELLKVLLAKAIGMETWIRLSISLEFA